MNSTRCLVFLILPLVALPILAEAAWKRHTIDNTSQGADGVRLADINRDQRLDVVTGWEEGGLVRAYVQPTREWVRRPWPQVTVGKVASPEDAVFVDLDHDGVWDVLSSCEGRTKSLFIHWSPRGSEPWRQATAWQTEAIPAAKGRESWMFALPLPMQGAEHTPIVLGSKGSNASVSLLIPASNTRNVADWTLVPIRSAGWIMSLRSFDFDRDGDLDILLSDRKGERSGVFWLENPGAEGLREPKSWKEHPIGAQGLEVMFLDLNEDAISRTISIVASVKPNRIFEFTRQPCSKHAWQGMPYDIEANTGTAKASHYADVDEDGNVDIIASSEHAVDGRIGVYWFSPRRSPNKTISQVHSISGPQGIKFDRLETIDLDGDGDLDVLTCEERDNLGVIWYENPTR